jgi:Family of unknown function (DUF6221)
MLASMTLTMTEFYAARLDEDEAGARDAYYAGQRWITEEEGVYRYPDDELVHYANRKADARHIARWPPDRALREVEAGRKLLAEYERLNAKHLVFRPPAPGALGAIRAAIGFRAAVHSAHPDYNPDWAPA